jgi:hypothetical protein
MRQFVRETRCCQGKGVGEVQRTVFPLVGPQVIQNNGAGLKLLSKKIHETAQSSPAELREYADALLAAVGTVGVCLCDCAVGPFLDSRRM